MNRIQGPKQVAEKHKLALDKMSDEGKRKYWAHMCESHKPSKDEVKDEIMTPAYYFGLLRNFYYNKLKDAA